MSEEEQVEIDASCMESIANTLKKLKAAKPEDRSELARYYAVTITELEKVYAHFYTWVIIGRGE